MKNYFPVLVSRKGETVALQHLQQNDKDDISPIVQVVMKEVRNEDREIIRHDLPNDLEDYFTKHWGFFGNQVMFDFSLFKELESHTEWVKKFLTNLLAVGVNSLPVVQSGGDKKYFDMIKDLIKGSERKICIRTSNNSTGGFLSCKKTINNLMSELKIKPHNVSLLFDMGQIDKTNYNDKKLGHGQYITHAKSLVASKDFSGEGFCWGDAKFYELSRKDEEKDKPGNSTNWVQYSQNHHIALLNSLLKVSTPLDF